MKIVDRGRLILPIFMVVLLVVLTILFLNVDNYNRNLDNLIEQNVKEYYTIDKQKEV